MKALVAAFLCLMLANPGWGQDTVAPATKLGPESTLNVASHYLDNIISNALASLELVASTPEARTGDWKGIKPYLQQLGSRLPGAYFYILPDGNYYSVALDYTNLNLSNRPYFKSLFAGNQVKGFPVYSRSTGKKSIVVAVPVVVNGKVTGALGISVFLDRLAAQMNRALALPGDYTWYVLNADGNTLLDQDSEFIFMNALTQGGSSLRQAVSEALRSQSGTVQYDLDGVRRARYTKLPDFEWWMFLAKMERGNTPPPPQLKISLDRFVPALQDSLDRIDAALAEAIRTHRINVGNEGDVRKLLNAVLAKNINIVEAAFVDPKGVMRYIEPADYRNFENSDISSQAHVRAMRRNPMPQFSGGFQAVEHFLAVVIARPIFDANKHYVGDVSLVVRPDLLVDALLRKTTIPDGFELWIMQPDGMIIYDQDKAEIGRMLFTDPVYADYDSLRALGRKIATAPTGTGSYIFLAPGLNEKTIKKVIWQTVTLHGRDWRVVLAYRPFEQAETAPPR